MAKKRSLKVGEVGHYDDLPNGAFYTWHDSSVPGILRRKVSDVACEIYHGGAGSMLREGRPMPWAPVACLSGEVRRVRALATGRARTPKALRAALRRRGIRVPGDE